MVLFLLLMGAFFRCFILLYMLLKKSSAGPIKNLNGPDLRAGRTLDAPVIVSVSVAVSFISTLPQ